ncbi:acyltransferase family protein [Deinococcus koreensis]|nr:acyltransferase family protein [Deinococcus koreensis]
MTSVTRTLSYRPELDGIRALAVLSVIFYHFDLPPFRGGYIGVDIFFVISGYLITGLIRQQLETGSFSFRNFYVRRFRRLIPASITVILGTSLLAGALFSSEMLAEHGKLSVASALSLANRELYFSSGYFDADAVTKPLLHMWSLSVEEQFYLVWPALLVLALRFLGHRTSAVLIAALSVVTAVACVYYTQSRPPAAFYLTPLRMFEFGIGALLLWLPLRLEERWGRISGLVGLAGLLLMACLLTAESTFPGTNAVWVALLSAALIHGSRSGAVHRLLRHPVAVFTGLISYSLYLVHWPVFVFYRFIVERPLTGVDRLALLALTVGLSLALYTWVERPFRVGSRASRRPAHLALVGVLYMTVLGSGVTAMRTHGFPERTRVAGTLPPTSADLQAIQDEACHEGAEPLVTCSSAADRAPTLYVWGDSHALHLNLGLVQARPARNVKVLYKSACVPLWGVSDLPYPRSRASRRECAQHNVEALTFLKGLPPTTIVLAARWKNYLNTPARERIGVAALKELVTDLQARGHQVLVVGNVIEPGTEVINCLRSPDTRLTPRSRCRPFETMQQRSAAINVALGALEPTFLDPTPLFCVPECRVALGQTLLFRDGHHLSDEGSSMVAQAIVRALQPPLATPGQ